MRTLDIGVDLDGVCYDFTGSLRHYLITHEGYDPARLPDRLHEDPSATWNFYKDCWGMTLQEFLDAVEAGVNAGVVFLHGEPFEHTVETLQGFHDAGHRIHLITTRNQGDYVHHNTSDWLAAHGIRFDTLAFTTHKGLFRPDIMIDDHIENQEHCAAVGVPCYLLTRPWNIHAPADALRVDSWDDFAKVVEEMANA